MNLNEIRFPADPAGIFGRPVHRVARVVAPLVLFSRRDPTLHRVVNATRANVEAPDVPYVETARTVAAKVQSSPVARAVLFRLAKVGVGAAGGAYLGYKAHRRAGIKPGAKAGAIAGLLFERPLSMNTTNRGNRVSLSMPELGKLLRIPAASAARLVASGAIPATPLYRGQTAGPVVMFTRDIAAANVALEETKRERPVEFAAYVLREEEKPGVVRRVATGAAVTAGVAAAGAYARGHFALGKRGAGLSPFGVALYGAKRLREDATKAGAKAAGFLRK